MAGNPCALPVGCTCLIQESPAEGSAGAEATVDRGISSIHLRVSVSNFGLRSLAFHPSDSLSCVLASVAGQTCKVLCSLVSDAMLPRGAHATLTLIKCRSKDRSMATAGDMTGFPIIMVGFLND